MGRMSATRSALPREFAAAYREQVDFVWRVLARHGVPDAYLEDATQEVFVVLHRRWGAWEGQASMRAWLYGVARRVASTHHRSQRRHRRKIEALPEPPEAPRLDERLEDRHRLQALARAISSLEPDRRDVLVLADVEGLSAPEISDALGIKLNTVYSRLRRARASLARQMADMAHHESEPLQECHHG